MTLTRQKRQQRALTMGEIFDIEGNFITTVPKWHARMFFRGMLPEDGRNFCWIPCDRGDDDLTWDIVHGAS